MQYHNYGFTIYAQSLESIVLCNHMRMVTKKEFFTTQRKSLSIPETKNTVLPYKIYQFLNLLAKKLKYIYDVYS